MAQIINWNQLNDKSLFEQLEEQLFFEMDIIEQNIYEDYSESMEIEKRLGYLREDKQLYLRKLYVSKRVTQKNIAIQQKYLEILLKIDLREDISTRQKIKMMLSYGVLVHNFKKIHERTDDELFFLSGATCALLLDEYQDYVSILSDSRVAQAIVSQTDQLQDQVDLAYDIMDKQYLLGNPEVNINNYELLVSKAVSIARSYRKSKEK